MLKLYVDKLDKYEEIGNLSDAEIARRMGTDPVTFSRIKRGHRPIPAWFVESLINLTGHEFADLFYWEREKA